MRCTAILAAVVTAAAISIGLPAAPRAAAVVGGQPADASAYPWLAAIGTPLLPLRPGGQFCAGALIAPDQVVTAAHCAVFTGRVPAALRVTFDRSDLRTDAGTSVRVTGVRVHPDFRVTVFGTDLAYHNDLAILTLDHPVQRPTVRIAAAHGTSGTILGWGATSDDDWANPLLHAATVPLDADCAAYGDAFDPREALCAGSTDADANQFDSGGPLLVDGELVALTSWGKGAAEPGYPGIYTRLSTLMF
ncbi:S1 family peptidase [Nocardia brasiliensis]|uniref:S1 family peptidase n=1 Tax=Nocardia brasiliensis TaxID=37326 RepID=UPI0024544DC1|nr:serine protease [Nocardia brasiliensis]